MVGMCDEFLFAVNYIYRVNAFLLSALEVQVIEIAQHH